MRALFAAISALILMFASPDAVAQQNGATAIISMSDPDAYARQLADRMTSEGVEALRAPLTELYAYQVHVPVASAQLPPQWQAQFTTMQTVIAGRRASVSREISDVTLADTLRSIHYYHYFGDNVWIFTRLDFVRVANGRWALSYLLWGGDASVVGISPSVTFSPSATN